MTDEIKRKGESGVCSKPLTQPSKGSTCLHSNNLEWQSDGCGFLYKELYDNPNACQRTLLMKVDPGAYSPLHSHRELEQIYVLEGSFYDGEKTYSAGDYIIRAPGTEHSTGSVDGAIALLVYALVS